MNIRELIGRSELTFSDYNGQDFDVKGITYDSRKVKPGFVFIAIKGLKDDGSKYIDNARSNGAGLIISEANDRSASDVIATGNPRRAMAELSRVFYGDPSRRLALHGITGTNGKTTTAYLARSIFQHAGISCGLIGTINYEYGDVKKESSLTTPDSVEMNMILSEMANAGMKGCVMEVSSIALVMDRVYGLKYKSGLFTNLTSEHLDFHGNMTEYYEAKKILFDNLDSDSLAFSNKDDEYGTKIVEGTKAGKFFYSLVSDSDLCPSNVSISVKGISFDISYNGKSARIVSKLTGRFNVYNILAAVSLCLNNGVGLGAAAEAVSKFEAVRGRFNRMHLPNGATAVVDYSHTSDSLKNAIESARDLVNLEGKNGRVITIFGCGGNKDRTKRPVMGRIAVSLSDYAVITSDNPRYEDPYVIIDEITAGTNGYKNYEVIEDRESAIKRGIEISGEGDIVLICGKGHETYQEVQGVRKHFDDMEIAVKYSNNAGRQ